MFPYLCVFVCKITLLTRGYMYIAHLVTILVCSLWILAYLTCSATHMYNLLAFHLVQNDSLKDNQPCGYFAKYYISSLDTVFTPAWYSGVCYFFPYSSHCQSISIMASVKQITAKKHGDKPKAKSCGHWIN